MSFRFFFSQPNYQAVISGNTFRNNMCTTSGCVTIRVTAITSTGAMRWFLQSNTIVNNVAHAATLFVDNAGNDVPVARQYVSSNSFINNSVNGTNFATMVTNSRVVNTTCNSFSDPLNTYEFYTSASAAGNSVNVQFNYWGSNNTGEANGKFRGVAQFFKWFY
jgi:hypothetical protein